MALLQLRSTCSLHEIQQVKIVDHLQRQPIAPSPPQRQADYSFALTCCLHSRASSPPLVFLHHLFQHVIGTPCRWSISQPPIERTGHVIQQASRMYLLDAERPCAKPFKCFLANDNCVVGTLRLGILVKLLAVIDLEISLLLQKGRADRS